MDTLTLVHVIISLVGIGSGFIVLFGLLTTRRLDGWTVLFLVSTAATSVTGFFFPFHKFTPAHAVGIISLVVLAVAIVARYARHLAGAWGWLYVVQRYGGLLSQCFCFDRAGLPEAARLESDGAHAVRASLLFHSTFRAGALRRADHCCSHQVPQRDGSHAGSYGLILALLHEQTTQDHRQQRVLRIQAPRAPVNAPKHQRVDAACPTN